MPSHATHALAALLTIPLALVACSPADSSSSQSSNSSGSNGEKAKGASESHGSNNVEHLEAQELERLPFDARLFTQGLEVGANGEVIVGTGQYGESGLFTLPVGSEKAEQRVANDDTVFGEGIAQYDSESGPVIWQLSWDSGEAYKYDAETFELIDTASYPGEGWGLCNLDDTSTLIMSDGTDELRHVDAETFEEQSRVQVSLNGESVDNINELECVGDDVFANVWFSTDILKIDPISGEVTGVIDASALDNNATDDPDHVLNGIAHIPGTEEFYLTGKRWPDMYRVSFEPTS